MLRMQPRLAVLALGAVAMAACDQAPTAPEPDSVPVLKATSSRIVEEFAFAFPYYLDCLDEEVLWSGVGIFESHVVTTPDGSTQENGNVSLAPGSTMIGVSGTWVDPKVVNHFNADNGNGNFHVNERITWANEGTGQKMDVWSRLHIVVTGAGEVKVLADTGGATCQMR